MYLTTGCSCEITKGGLIIAVHGIRNKGQAIPARDLTTSLARKRDWEERHGQ